MTTSQTFVSDEMERFLVSMCQDKADEINFVFASAFKFEEPFMQVSRLQALTLLNYVKSNKIKTIFEVGSFVGYSSFAMGLAMPKARSQLISIEKNQDFWAQAEQNRLEYVRLYPETNNIIPKTEFVCSDAKDYLNSNSDKIREFDMVFLDGDKENYAFYIDWFLREGKDGMHFLVDNILFKGSIMDGGKYASGILSALKALHAAPNANYHFNPVGDCMLIARKG